MRRQTQLAKLIEASEDKIRYDTQVKKVLANEAILAWILKTCTEEFASCSLHEIRKCIGVPEISRKAVHQNEPDAPLDSDRQIESIGTEDGSLGEQTVFYDIRFHACAPGDRPCCGGRAGVSRHGKGAGAEGNSQTNMGRAEGESSIYAECQYPDQAGIFCLQHELLLLLLQGRRPEPGVRV